MVAVDRMTWMDTVRGVAIALVVFVHAATILVRFDFGTPPGWLVAANEVVAPARMPTLMFLSGMLLTASLRKPIQQYVEGKLRRIAWPFVLWNVVFAVVFPFAGSLLSLNFWTTSYLWFLLYVLVFYAMAPVTRWVPPWILVLAPWLSTMPVDDVFTRRFLFLMGFFFLGKIVADNDTVLRRVMASRWVWITIPLAGLFGIAYSLADPPRYIGLYAPLSLVQVAAVVKLAQATAGSAWTRPVQFVGRHSLIFYVTHFPLITAVLVVGTAQGVSTSVLIVVGFLAAVVGGVLGTWASERGWGRILFELPTPGRERLATRA